MIRFCLRILALLLLVSVPLRAHAASFDCNRAATPDERTVCADPLLSDLDSTLAAAFFKAKKVYGSIGYISEVLAKDHDFMQQRRACGAGHQCVLMAYVEAIDRLGAIPLPPWVTAPLLADGHATVSSKLPVKIGQCTMTRVTAVQGRLQGDTNFSSGMSLDFTNGGSQVSYSVHRAALQAKPGDPAMMCLISIPHPCPPGDNRGRGYTTTDLRTGGTWSMGDSEHMCGGA